MSQNLTRSLFTPFYFFVFIAFAACSTHRKAQDKDALLEAMVVEKIGQATLCHTTRGGRMVCSKKNVWVIMSSER